MLFTFDLKTSSQGLIDITSEVTEAISESGVYEGICVVFCPHTTASVMIKGDDADADDAHGQTSETIIISGGKPLLGKRQRIYFCEYSAPESRKFYVRIV